MGSENVKKQSESKVPFDISRAPLGFRASSALVTELSKLDDRFERHYLEIKSDIDPSKNELAKIAKYILGSANRMPEKAATAFAGYGVMVVGIVPGKITGVPFIEYLDIDKIVSGYIGPTGPNWDLIHVPVADSTNSVLVILVDPPQDGQDAFVCRKDGDSLSNGRIYIRADGETREARANEVDLLLKRGKRSAAAEIGFDVEVLGYANPVEIDEQRTLETHILNTVEGLLRALPQPEPKPKSILTDDGKRQRETERKTAPETGRLDAYLKSSSVSALSEALKPSLAAAAVMSQLVKPHQTAMAKMAGELAALQKSSALNAFNTTDPEKRTEEQYRKAIEQWEGKLRKAWPQAVGTLTAYALDAVSIRVKNKAKTFFRDLELKIHVEGDIDGLDWLDGSDSISAHRLDLLKPPRVWGPTQRSMLGRDFFQPQYMQNTSVPSVYRSPLNWKNGGSVDVTLKVGELRPLGEYLFDDEELVLVLPLTSDARVKGTWQITASGHDEIYTGELQVEVGPAVDLTMLMRRLLLLDSN